jgi:hypothetical protein
LLFIKIALIIKDSLEMCKFLSKICTLDPTGTDSLEQIGPTGTDSLEQIGPTGTDSLAKIDAKESVPVAFFGILFMSYDVK